MKRESVKTYLDTDISTLLHIEDQSKGSQKPQKFDSQELSGTSHRMYLAIDPYLPVGSYRSGNSYQGKSKYKKQYRRSAETTIKHIKKANISRNEGISHNYFEYNIKHQDLKNTRAKLKSNSENFKKNFSVRSMSQNHLLVQSRNHDTPESSTLEPVEVSKESLEEKYAINYLSTPKLAYFIQSENLSVPSLNSNGVLHAKPSFPSNFSSISEYRKRSFPQGITAKLTGSSQFKHSSRKRKKKGAIALTHIVYPPRSKHN